jgi:hypothetical protein
LKLWKHRGPDELERSEFRKTVEDRLCIFLSPILFSLNLRDRSTNGSARAIASGGSKMAFSSIRDSTCCRTPMSKGRLRPQRLRPQDWKARGILVRICDKFADMGRESSNRPSPTEGRTSWNGSRLIGGTHSIGSLRAVTASNRSGPGCVAAGFQTDASHRNRIGKIKRNVSGAEPQGSRKEAFK